MDDLKIIRKKYGEKMMHLCRELFPSLLEVPGLLSTIMLEHFADNKFLYEDIIKFDMLSNTVESFKNYIYSFVDVEKGMGVITNKSPYELMNEAGYVLYECKTEDEIQSFKKYYKSGEELCTFRGGRLDTCYVFFAVKKDVENIKREDFLNPQREDEYGTSVISIQFRKNPPNTVSIKNRYNHTVNNPDNTFNNNLDNIIPGLTESFVRTCNYSLTANSSNFELPGYVFVDGKFYKCIQENNNIYYCQNNIIIDNFTVIDKYSKNPERYIVLNNIIVDLHSKTIELYDKNLQDGFVDEFKNITKMVLSKDKDSGDKSLIITYDENKSAIIKFNKYNEIIEYSNHYLTEMKDMFFSNVCTLRNIDVPNLQKMNNGCLSSVRHLQSFNAPNLVEMGNRCFEEAWELKEINVPMLKIMGNYCLKNINVLSEFEAPSLESIGYKCFEFGLNLKVFNASKLVSVGDEFLNFAQALTVFVAPKLVSVGSKHFVSIEEIFMNYLISRCSNLVLYIDANNKYVVPKEDLNALSMENESNIRNIIKTVSSITDNINLIIKNGMYKIKEFKNRILNNIKGGYRK